MEMDETNTLKRLRPHTTTTSPISKLETLDHEDSQKRLSLPWSSAHPSSRIYRVSRTSGGKDRHSKVYTAKGIRDRRVRLSVSTAIQFYDLQDRLGYDQPSKAIEWLIKAASNAIDKLPSLDHSFGTNEGLMVDNNHDAELDQTGYNNNSNNGNNYNNNNQGTKSGCSSTSETSKGSVLSLSRSENRVKARERARERTKDKEVKNQDENTQITQTNQAQNGSSFTELLTGPSSSVNLPTAAVLTTADYFKINNHNHNHHHHNNNNNNAQMQHIFSPQVYSNLAHMINFPNNVHQNGDTSEHHQYSFLQDNSILPVAQLAPAGDNYNLNFSISSGNLMGVNSRGTLQSNLPRLVSSQLDGPSLNMPFLFAPGAPAGAPSGATSAENQYFQIWDGYPRHHDNIKHKGKN